LQQLCHHIAHIFDNETGEDVCGDCGQVLISEPTEQPIEQQKGAYIPQNSFSPADYSLNGLMSGQMDSSNLDCRGERIKSPDMINRLRFVDRFIAKKDSIGRDRAYRNAMWVITTLSDKLKLSATVKGRAAQIYKEAYLKKAVRGRSTLGIASAAVYLSCKELNVKRNHSEFLAILEDQSDWRKNLFINYRTLIYFLNIEAPAANSPTSEMPGIASACGIPEKGLRLAVSLYNKVRAHDMTIFYGKSPSAIATCFLFIAAKQMNLNIKNEDIVKAGNISSVTLRKRIIEYNALLEKIDKEAMLKKGQRRSVPKKEKGTVR
jgi:transcription initiation factor TFIIB